LQHGQIKSGVMAFLILWIRVISYTDL